MGIVGGAMTVARFRVVGELAEGFREVYRDRLNEFAFAEPPQGMGSEEVEGWVQVHNLLDTEFDDFNKWLYNDIAIFALRVDKKRLPQRLFRATLDRRVRDWCTERDLERCPAQVRATMKEDLEAAWFAKTLPSVGITEAAWEMNTGIVILHSLADSAADRFRKRFYRTFGLQMVPWSPLDYLDDDSLTEAMVSSVPSSLKLDPSTVYLAGGEE